MKLKEVFVADLLLLCHIVLSSLALCNDIIHTCHTLLRFFRLIEAHVGDSPFVDAYFTCILLRRGTKDMPGGV